ncbi:MAG: AraC family transcriptional regulator [Eubacteriales bacterium]|nr:AraC family transcriptional regulator [Eubacteriales bacterium]
MDWIERLNQAVGYIDRNLDGDISYEEISRITISPIALFQRFFVLATGGVTLSEYIRRRKLTRALIDLQNSDAKVIDIAIKYGYESSDAFYVAFKRLYGITPSQAKKNGNELKHYDRIFFTLTITYVKGENDVVLLNIDKYRYYGPLFEGARIIMNNIGEKYSPEYIQGISGAAFKIAGGCPSCPTCVCDMWPAELFKLLGYEVKEYPCFDEKGKDVYDILVEAVKKQIDSGKPALVWHAFTVAEWDVVCGYDEEARQFIGRGTNKGWDDYARESWDRPKTCDVGAYGAIIIGGKIAEFNKREAEINSIKNAVKHARKETSNRSEGIQFYKKWIEIYSSKGADRGIADGYCYDIYSSVRKACIGYLREVSLSYGGTTMESLLKAGTCFDKEANILDEARPYLSWDSPWGIDEERSKKVVPLLIKAAELYEKGIEYLEIFLTQI